MFWCCCVYCRGHLAWLWATVLCAVSYRSGRMLAVGCSNLTIAWGGRGGIRHFRLDYWQPSPHTPHRPNDIGLRTAYQIGRGLLLINYIYTLSLSLSIYIYISVSKLFLRCPTPRLHCFLSSHWPSFCFLSFSLKYLHLDEGIFCRVRRLAWCNDPESYAGGSVATGRATLAGQVKGEYPDKVRCTGPPGWGLVRWASNPSPG